MSKTAAFCLYAAEERCCPYRLQVQKKLCYDRICVHTAVNVTTADTCIHVRISSAHAHSSTNTDTVMIEPSSSSAPANNRGNSAPQQKKDAQQHSIRPQAGSGNAPQCLATKVDLLPAAWQNCMSTAYG